MSNQTPALLISGLQKTYGNLDVLKGVDLTLTSGGIQGLVGLNGSGKTTTLECILGLQRFDQGEVSVLGLVPTDLCTAQGKVTAVFDSPSLNPNLTVRQCLQHASLLSKESRRHPKELEKLLGLCQFSNFPIKTLSLGNKRRASIAHALISEPHLVIMDEPFNGLDAGGVDEVLLLIKSLNQERGTSFLLSSHQLPYLEDICSHLAILHEGKIIRSGEKSALLRSETSKVRLRTNDPVGAASALQTISGISCQPGTMDEEIWVSADVMNAAAINSHLAQHRIPVYELATERASLGSLFRRLTQGSDS